MTSESVTTHIANVKQAISKLERVLTGESTTPEQIAEQTAALKATMGEISNLSEAETQAHRKELTDLRHHLDQVMQKLVQYQKSIRSDIQTNIIRAKANKQYGGGK